MYIENFFVLMISQYEYLCPHLSNRVRLIIKPFQVVGSLFIDHTLDCTWFINETSCDLVTAQ